MTWGEFLIIFLSCTVTMVICRVAPLFALKGRTLPARAIEALNLIPPATFAALIANDLFKPETFAAGVWPAALPLIASAVVLVIGYRTKSLVWCIVVGVCLYGFMMLI